jgi:nitronate monooxygenase
VKLHVSAEGEAKAWKDVWSAGQGVGSIHDVPGAADLCGRLIAEYREAVAVLVAGGSRSVLAGETA